MYIIAGLGNPGSKYENTRHNVGFQVIDILADRMGILVEEMKRVVKSHWWRRLVD